MAHLEDKIAEIADFQLRQTIADEVAKLKKRTRFGLVFEEHQPEVVPIHGARIKRGERVALRNGNLAEIWRVLSVRDGQAHCQKDKDGTDRETFDEKQLIVVRRMGEAIYPALTPMGAVKNADPAQPHHLLLEADNYHALQLLLFPYEGKLDCIYIDPPYNTGARDWKYNNDYVDGNDSWRHSKWLTFMAKRLRLAKRLLRPDDSVLIVTIDEKEYLNLGMLLRQEFPDARIQMVSSVINPKGTARANEFSRIDEYIFFVALGDAPLTRWNRDMLTERDYSEDEEVRWRGLARTGRKGLRPHNPGSWYPIYIKNDGSGIHSVGDTVPLGSEDPADPPQGTFAIWPPSSDGQQYSWSVVPETLRELISRGAVRIGRVDLLRNSVPIYYLSFNQLQQIEEGDILITGRAVDGTLQIAYADGGRSTAPKTVWNMTSHDAGSHGTNIIRALLPGRRFPFPKSLYAIEDALRFFVANKPGALILDFFAGSGTTAHAVMRLNRQDGGHRQCIAVTNNEVAADEQAALREQGLQPGHPDWEKWGICNHITYPRLAAAITGNTPDGEPIKGDYRFTDEFPMAIGFAANLEYFRLDFLEPAEVQMGRQFAAILPILWMMAGARGPRPEPPDPHAPWLLPAGCPFAVLMQETRFKDFLRHVEERDDLTHVFVVTNSTDTVYKLRKEWSLCRVVQLYKDYLENFRINLSENAAP